MSTLNDPKAAARAGAEAYAKGDARSARDLFTVVVESGQADASIFLALAYACRELKDEPNKIAAVDRALAMEPRNVPALILKADHLAQSGDASAASSFYLAAVRNAPPLDKAPSDLVKEIRRAQEMCTRYAAQYAAYLQEQLAAQGFDEKRSSRRFAESLDVLFGRKRVYVQQPRYYYLPGLPQRQFYESREFPWMAEVEQATGDIRSELQEILQDESAFAPYVQGAANRPHKEQDGMLNNPAWSAFYLWKNGALVEANANRCPRTLRALENVPLARIPNRSPSVLFSLLRAGAHIPPHNGLINARLICHLPLIVPGQCLFRVGNDVREWREGEAWAFDDTIEHEAWNRTERTRVILLFEIWRPEVSEEERRLVCALFEAIDAYTGRKPDWEI